MERRTFIGVMAGSLFAAPLAAEVQQAGEGLPRGHTQPGVLAASPHSPGSCPKH